MGLRQVIPSFVLFTSLAVAPLVGADLQVGWAEFKLDTPGAAPAGAALFQLRNPEGVLVAETGVEAARILRRGRIFVQQSNSVRTGLALANPNDRQVNLGVEGVGNAVKGWLEELVLVILSRPAPANPSSLVEGMNWSSDPLSVSKATAASR